MANFKYTTIETSGKSAEGLIRANTKDEATKLLSDQGLYVLTLEELIEKKHQRKKKVKLVEKLVFFDHLAQMLKAGLSLPDTLDALKDDTENPYFKGVIEDITYGIQTGNTLASQMEKYPDVFPNLFSKMIEVGEISGSLEESATQIATQVKRDYELRSKVKGALIYPEILAGIMVIAGAGLLLFVIPQLSAFFKQSGLSLPITTQILISLSDFLKKYYLLVLVVIVAGRFGLIRLKKNPKFKQGYDTIILRLPIVGPLTKKINIATFARTLGSLLKSGIPIGKSLEIVASSLQNSVYANATQASKGRIEKGEPLSAILHDYQKLFSNLAIRMVAVGDKTGTTPDMLFNVADFYQNQVNETLANVSTIIEPVMLFIMGGATLFIAISVITPIYQLTSGISASSGG